MSASAKAKLALNMILLTAGPEPHYSKMRWRVSSGAMQDWERAGLIARDSLAGMPITVDEDMNGHHTTLLAEGGVVMAELLTLENFG